MRAELRLWLPQFRHFHFQAIFQNLEGKMILRATLSDTFFSPGSSLFLKHLKKIALANK